MAHQRTVFLCLVVGIIYQASVMAQTAPNKLPVPSEAAQAQAMALVREIYKSDYDKSTTTEQKVALAQRMIQKATETKDDPASHFVLLKVARDLAVQARKINLACQAIDQMAVTYEIDGIPMKLEVVSKIARTARLPDEHEVVASHAMTMVKQFVAADRLPEAIDVGKIALASARQSRKGDLVRQVIALNREVEAAANEYTKVEVALKTLETSPADPQANLLVGKYFCFQKNDWDKGIPMLALGNDEQLKALAVKELKGEGDPLAMGDAWWELAGKESGKTQEAMKGCAACFYRQALPTLTGLKKVKAEKRVKEAVVQRMAPKPVEKQLTEAQRNRLAAETVFKYGGTICIGDASKGVASDEGVVKTVGDLPKGEFRIRRYTFGGSLALKGVSLNDDKMKSLLQIDVPTLKCISFNNIRGITPESLLGVLKPSVVEFHIIAPWFTDEWCKVFVSSFPNLETWALGSRITDRSVEYLKQLKHLKHLRLYTRNLSPSAVDELKQAFPNCKIIQQ